MWMMESTPVINCRNDLCLSKRDQLSHSMICFQLVESIEHPWEMNISNILFHITTTKIISYNVI